MDGHTLVDSRGISAPAALGQADPGCREQSAPLRLHAGLPAVRLPNPQSDRRLRFKDRDGCSGRTGRPLLVGRSPRPAQLPAQRVLCEQLGLRGPRYLRRGRRRSAVARDRVDGNEQRGRRHVPFHAPHGRHVPRRRSLQLCCREAQLRPRLGRRPDEPRLARLVLATWCSLGVVVRRRGLCA